MSIVSDPLADPAFLRGLVDVIAVSIVAGVVGTFIVLRGIGFLGDALTHNIFPGVVIAFLLGANLLLGALAAGLLSALVMGLLTASRRVEDNTSVGVIFTASFALGVVILTNRPIASGQLEGILFGEPLNASPADVLLTIVIGGAVLATVVALRRLFVMASFDPNGARAMGLPVVTLDILLLALTALTVVVSFKAVGNILVIALLITPAATARLFVDRLVPTAVLAAALGCTASVIGIFIGYHADTSAGGVIVLTSTVAFFAAWLFAPQHGIIPVSLARSSRTLLEAQPEAEAEIILASPEIQAPHQV